MDNIMVFYRKKSAIDRRLEELHKEMSRVNRKLKTASRPYPAVSGSGMLSGKSPDRMGKEPVPVPLAASGPAADGAETQPPESDLFDPVRHRDAVTPMNPADLFPGLSVPPAGQSHPPAPAEHTPGSRSGRERFANYFMAGHFQNLHPSRQENRVLKNKAILMLIAVAVLLVWLLYFWSSR